MTTRPGKKITTRPIDAPDSLVGRVLDGRYRLESVIEMGGMGIIFEAHQLPTARRVAVKVLRPTLSNDVDLHTRFRHEIETLSRLSHPNIVRLYDCGQDAAGLHYMVMELVQGRTFRERLRECELTLPEIVEVFAQTADALVEAHAQGIIHRDLKFDNIMVRRFEDARLHVSILDFGVAKLLTRDESVTRSGEVPGTPGIIAPELADGVSASPQSDLYSLGILLFTALTGRMPFEGENEFELMRAHQTQDLPRLETLLGNRVPEALRETVYELTHKNPRLRPRTASAVRDRLETIAADIRRQHRDIPRYRPPSQEALGAPEDKSDPPHDEPALRTMEFLAGNTADDVAPESARPADPVLVPVSVVGLLIGILIVLVLGIIYFVYRTEIIGK